MDNFTDLYVSYCKDQTDAPVIYHKFISYFIVSSIVNRNAYVPFGFRRLYPNLFMLIIGPSTLKRKSWAQDIGLDLIRSINSNLMIYETSSRQSFLAEMADEERTPRECGVVALDELKGFIEKSKGKHFQGFIQDLASMYTGQRIKYRRGVKNKKEGDNEVDHIELNNPFLNLSACCSFDWLTESIQASDIFGGFFARFLWVISNEPNLNPMLWPGSSDPEKRRSLINKLQSIQSALVGAEFKPSEAALAVWGDWYRSFRLKTQNSRWDANYERLTAIAMKLALLNAIIRLEASDTLINPESHTIEPIDLHKSIAIVTDTLQGYREITLGDTKTAVMMDKVLKYIVKNGKCTRSALLRGVRGINADFLDTVQRTLEQADQITITPAITDREIEIMVYAPTELGIERIEKL